MRFKVILSLLYITPVLCQYSVNSEMRADVTFGEPNDRYDISNIIQEQRQFEEYLAKHRMNRHHSDSSEESRRSFRYPDNMSARRVDGGFANHDDMNDDIDGPLDDFEKRLAIFRNLKDGRRNLNILKNLGMAGTGMRRMPGKRHHGKIFKHGRIDHGQSGYNRRSGKKMTLEYKVPVLG